MNPKINASGLIKQHSRGNDVKAKLDCEEAHKLCKTIPC